MAKKVAILLLLSGFLIPFGLSQEVQPAKECYRLIDQQTFKSIPYAHIYNESKRFGAIGDSTGSFEITASVGDTLVLLALGYLGETYIIKANEPDTCKHLFLKAHVFEIDPVEVRMPRNYAQLKQAILNLEEEKIIVLELPEHNPFKTPEVLDTNITHTLGYIIFHPVSGIYTRFSKEEKSKRQVWYLQQQGLRQLEVDEKYNRQLVSEITGYSGNDLTQFMLFCDFKFNYLLETSHYDIILAIEEKQREFIACCYDKKNQDSIPE